MRGADDGGFAMPGFMGLRGLETASVKDFARERREQRGPSLGEAERRSREKVQEILNGQEHVPPEDANRATIYLPNNGGQCSAMETTTVDRIMSGRVAVLTFDDTVLTVRGIFDSVRFHHLPVVDEQGSIIGIISDRDFLRLVSPFFGTVNEQSRDKEIMTRKVGMIMTRNPICVGPDTTVVDAVKLMNGERISCLPVVEHGSKKLMGLITWKDVVRAFCPAGFDKTRDSNRLKTGVHINPPSSESARLKAKSAESVRLRARSGEEGERPAQPHLAEDQMVPPTEEKLARPPYATPPEDGPRNKAGRRF